VQWQSFEKDWADLLPGLPPPLTAFKMSQMDSDFRQEMASWFYRVIERHVAFSLSCVVVVPDLIRVLRETTFPSFISNLHELENPYFIAFASITRGLAINQDRLGIRSPIDFVFDEETELVKAVNGWAAMKAAVPQEVSALMGATPTSGKDELMLPLQAADLIAWWVRKWELEGTTRESFKFSWQTRKTLPAMHARLDEHYFRGMIADWLSPETMARVISNSQ
jgi:hypothetical protein